MSNAINIGIAGLGTVGIGLINIFDRHADIIARKAGRNINIHGVCARDMTRDRGIDLDKYHWEQDARKLAVLDDIDIFVEMIGGEEGIAHEAVRAALEHGKHVVTANKALLAMHGAELARIAEKNRVSLNFEAAVAGGIPIVKTLRESLTGNEVSRIFGILNGTCNYILTLMKKEGRSFEDILKDAQAAGYAEADPTFDIDGQDTAHKLTLLTTLSFGTQPAYNEIYIEGIRTITTEDIAWADRLGYKIKLLGVAQKTDSGIEQRVHPTMVPKHSAIAEVDGVTNCVAINGDFVGDVMLIGPGAGAGPTASAVMGDIIDIARGQVVPPFINSVDSLSPYKKAKMRAHEGGYYIRLTVQDIPGVFASIATHMARNGISLESIVQRAITDNSTSGDHQDTSRNSQATIVLITHDTTEKSVRDALETIKKDCSLVQEPQMIRIEKL